MLRRKHKHTGQTSKPEHSHWRGRTILASVCALLVMAALLYYLLQILPARLMEERPIAAGAIVESRVVVARILEGQRGTIVDLQPEIHVNYLAAGGSYSRWFALPARRDLTRLQMEQKTKQLVGSHCQVHWKESDPLDAYVTESPEAGATPPAAP